MWFVYYDAGNSHWICVSTDGNFGDIKVFDSLATMGFTVDAVLQIAKLYSLPADHSELLIKRHSVQQQRGCTDCGLFAVAYAVEVCCGRNPAEASFVQEKMREHLQLCLSKGILVAFPRALPMKESVVRPKGGVLTVQVFCYCKMPAQYDTDMIQCETCSCWFHCSCMGINPSRVPEVWDCQQCSV